MQSLTLTPATQPPVDPAILKGKLEDSSPRIEYVETKDVLPVTDGNDAVPQKTYTLKEISTHNRPNDMWLVIDNEVLDVSEFKDEHPGGAKILNGVAGKDATKKFDKYHRRGILSTYRSSLRVGVVDLGEAMTSSKRDLFRKIGIGKK